MMRLRSNDRGSEENFKLNDTGRCRDPLLSQAVLEDSAASTGLFCGAARPAPTFSYHGSAGGRLKRRCCDTTAASYRAHEPTVMLLAKGSL